MTELQAKLEANAQAKVVPEVHIRNPTGHEAVLSARCGREPVRVVIYNNKGEIAADTLVIPGIETIVYDGRK